VGEDGGLIAGHARILAARQLGIAEIPVMVAAGWTEAQKRAYVLANGNFPVLSKQPVTPAISPSPIVRAASSLSPRRWGTPPVLLEPIVQYYPNGCSGASYRSP
jgi:hypothetical protein